MFIHLAFSPKKRENVRLNTPSFFVDIEAEMILFWKFVKDSEAIGRHINWHG